MFKLNLVRKGDIVTTSEMVETSLEDLFTNGRFPLSQNTYINLLIIFYILTLHAASCTILQNKIMVAASSDVRTDRISNEYSMYCTYAFCKSFS
jgi:hypothetical protein